MIRSQVINVNTEELASEPSKLHCYSVYMLVDIDLKFSNKPVEQLDGVCWENTTDNWRIRQHIEPQKYHCEFTDENSN